jgi:hypothetical protein
MENRIVNKIMENNTFEKLIHKIPSDVIRENILPYTYKPQPKELCEDIQSFFYTRNVLYYIYQCRYGDNEYESEIAWLENDIIRFMNDDIATMFGYSENHINKFRRLYIFHDKSDHVIINGINTMYKNKSDKYENEHIIRCISCMLAILTCNERIKLMEFLKDFDTYPDLMDIPYYAV